MILHKQILKLFAPMKVKKGCKNLYKHPKKHLNLQNTEFITFGRLAAKLLPHTELTLQVYKCVGSWIWPYNTLGERACAGNIGWIQPSVVHRVYAAYKKAELVAFWVRIYIVYSYIRKWRMNVKLTLNSYRLIKTCCYI